jgi:hypothetical protein
MLTQQIVMGAVLYFSGRAGRPHHAYLCIPSSIQRRTKAFKGEGNLPTIMLNCPIKLQIFLRNSTTKKKA